MPDTASALDCGMAEVTRRRARICRRRRSRPSCTALPRACRAHGRRCPVAAHPTLFLPCSRQCRLALAMHHAILMPPLVALGCAARAIACPAPRRQVASALSGLRSARWPVGRRRASVGSARNALRHRLPASGRLRERAGRIRDALPLASEQDKKGRGCPRPSPLARAVRVSPGGWPRPAVRRAARAAARAARVSRANPPGSAPVRDPPARSSRRSSRRCSRR
jgi:hypothetical protein